jgi:hypothetical protein
MRHQGRSTRPAVQATSGAAAYEVKRTIAKFAKVTKDSKAASDSNAPTEGEQLVFCFMQFDHEQMHLSGNIAELLAYVRTISASHCCIDNLKVIFDLRFCGANPRLVFSERQTIRSDLALNY